MLEFGKIVYEEYKISSMPFTNKSDAYDGNPEKLARSS